MPDTTASYQQPRSSGLSKLQLTKTVWELSRSSSSTRLFFRLLSGLLATSQAGLDNANLCFRNIHFNQNKYFTPKTIGYRQLLVLDCKDFRSILPLLPNLISVASAPKKSTVCLLNQCCGSGSQLTCRIQIILTRIRTKISIYYLQKILYLLVSTEPVGIRGSGNLSTTFIIISAVDPDLALSGFKLPALLWIRIRINLRYVNFLKRFFKFGKKKIMVANPLPDPVLGEPHLTLLLLVGEKGHKVLGLVVLVPPHPPDLGCTSKIINK